MTKLPLFALRFFLLLLFCVSMKSRACDCKQMNPLTIVECRKFDAILQCKIDSVSTCDTKSIAYAKVLEVYKGDQLTTVELVFDCSSSCQLSFAKEEVWLIYGKLDKELRLELNFCDRNRKYFDEAKADYYATNLGLSYADEVNYLKKNIGLKISKATPAESKAIDITQRENSFTSGGNNILLLLASLVFFLLIYFVVNKKIK